MARSDIFTPSNISKRMVKYLHPNGSLLEPSVGTGHLLCHLNLDHYVTDAYDINADYLEMCAKTYTSIRVRCEDFLSAKLHQTYQNIILNPPYIRLQDLEVDYRSFIKKEWPILSKGNIDIYYAFLVKCLDCLADDGVMVAITPNSYLYNKSALSFRRYLIKNRFVKKIIDYQSKKVFPSVSAYCCITVFTKTPNTHFIYVKGDKDEKDDNEDNKDENKISYEKCTDSFLVSSLPSPSSKTLGDVCRVRNGIATLRDKIFIHPTKNVDEPCWKPLTTPSSEMWVIYPYENGIILKEEVFKEKNPKTYKYLLSQKKELEKRDKGKKTYPEWYAYGRTQSLTISQEENVLYIPVFIDPSVDIPCSKAPPSLFSGCLCIDQFKDKNIDHIKKLIVTNRDHITKYSSKRGGGWINLTSTILKMIPYS